MKNQQQVIAGGELGPPPASERISPPAGNDGSHGLRHLHQRETASGASAPSSHQRTSALTCAFVHGSAAEMDVLARAPHALLERVRELV